MKKDNFATPMVLNFERLTYARPFTVILRKRFILFLPYLRMDQNNSWVKKQTPSLTKPKRNFKFEYFDFSIPKDIRKMLRTVVLYKLKMKICYDPCFIDIGVAMVTQWRHFLFNLPLYFLVPGVFSEIIIVQFLIRRGRWIKAPKTYLYMVSLEPWRATVVRWWEHSPPTNICGPGSNPSVDFKCGLSLLLVLSLAPRGFFPDTPVFPSP